MNGKGGFLKFDIIDDIYMKELSRLDEFVYILFDFIYY